MDNPPRHVYPADPGRAREFARRIRAEHLREIFETAGTTPEDALSASLRASVEAYMFIPGGRREDPVVFMMGVEAAGAVTGGAVVWMLAAAEASRHPTGVLRTARWGVGRAYRATGAVYLEQHIPAWYQTGIRFVQRLGFSLHPSCMPVIQAPGRDDARETGRGGGLVRVVHEKVRAIPMAWLPGTGKENAWVQ